MMRSAMPSPRQCLLFLVAVFLLRCGPIAVAAEANYDEAKVPPYQLPDLLTGVDGRQVATTEDWKGWRRAEVLGLFSEHVYGRAPEASEDIAFEVRSTDTNALGGLAIRKEIVVFPIHNRPEHAFEILVYLPRVASKPVPAFLGLNFFGNHTVHADPQITLSERWMRSNAEKGVVDHQATEASRGTSANRWPIEKIVGRGYALATVYCGDFEPDHAEGWRNGVRFVFDESGLRQPGEWSCIGAWAWGLSRTLDYLETDPDIDGQRVTVLGHSRLGKTALWAGAQDERFAAVISNNSGEGGAALARRRFGETTARINTSFPHWFCSRFKAYNHKENQLPVDQHMLLALVAPRPLYVASAEEDLWADPRGEFLSAKHASPVYELLGVKGITNVAMPDIHEPVGDRVRYHIRAGKHDVTDYDWDRYLDFADRHLAPAAAEVSRAGWPRFRGATGMGLSSANNLPLNWSQTDNVIWKTPLPGSGASSPIVWGDQIYLTSYSGYSVPGEPDGNLEDLRRHLVAINRTTGQIIWDRAIPAKLPEEERIRDHGYAANTPIADADCVYAFFGKSGVRAFDHAGELQWEADVGDRTSGWGTAASPVLHEGLLIVNASVESESLVALDRLTGERVWEAGGIQEAWNTPLGLTAPSGRQEMVVATKGSVQAFAPGTGEPLWTCETDISWYMVPSPVAAQGVLYFLGGRSGVAGLAVRAGGSGNVTASHRLWTSLKGSNVSSPVYHGGHLYWVQDQRGIAYCAQASSGEIVYEQRLERAGQFYSSPVLADGRLYYLDRSGKTFVLAARPEFEQLAVNDLRDGSRFDGSPAVDGQHLLIRSGRFLYCIGG